MAIEYKTVTYRTVESANSNATYCWVELSASHVPAVNGLIKRIVIQGATNGTVDTTDPMYLGIWERQDDGGLIFLGCSKNAIVQAINQQNVWDFDGAIIRGKSLLLGLLSSLDEHWTNNTQLLLRSRVQTNDTDGCVILTNIGRLKVTPDITFTVDVPEYVPDDEPEPEPDTEPQHRIVDISKYWIQIIRNTNEFKQIAIAENPEFNGLLDAIYRALKDGFILEATDYGVSRWEKILKLVVTEGMTLEDRKVQILTYLSVKLPYTKRVLYQMLIEYLGEGNFYFFIDNDTQTFHLSLTAGAMSKQADVDQLLKRVLPMNLVVKYDDVPMDYTLLEYLESSGTQNIKVPAPNLMETKEIWNVETDCQFLTDIKTRIGFINRGGLAWGSYDGKIGTGAIYILDVPCTDRHIVTYTTTFHSIPASAPTTTNWRQTISVAGQKKGGANGNGKLPATWEYGLFRVSYEATNVSNPVRIWSCKCWCDSVSYDLVPVLDASGTPCMYDKVSKTCFYNKGTGSFGYRLKSESDIMTLELDDPYYTAPSGVWAKLIDENTLDIITALDPTVDESQGYKLFANTVDAYKYFNIKEVIENE